MTNDAISRQAAIDAIISVDMYDLIASQNYYKQKRIEKLKNLPPVKPKAKTGHWIEHDCKSLSEMGYYRCSECNHGYQRYERGVRKSEVPYINGQKYELHRVDNYCPNCGAKMEG